MAIEIREIDGEKVRFDTELGGAILDADTTAAPTVAPASAPTAAPPTPLQPAAIGRAAEVARNNAVISDTTSNGTISDA